MSGGPFGLQRPKIYFDAPEELAPEPVLESVPVLPELELPVLGELELGEDVAPLEELGELELGEALEPLEDVSCSRRQRSFSVPVIASHCVLLLPTEGELEELPLALGEVVLLEPPLAPEDESAAMATVEAANSAASVAVESTFNIRASPL